MHFKCIRYALSAALIIFAAYFIYSNFKVSYKDIPALFREADKFLIFAVIGSQGLCYLSDGWLSKTLIRIAGYNINLRNTVSVAILGVVGSQIAPFVGGALLIFYFFKRLKLPSAAILFSITTWTIFVALFYFLAFIASLFLVPQSYFSLIPQKLTIIIPIISVALIVFGYFLLREKGKKLNSLIVFFMKLINKTRILFKKKETAGPHIIKTVLSDFYNNFNLLMTNKRKIPYVLTAALLFYVGNIASFYFSFLVFGYRPHLAVLIFGQIISMLLAVFTFMPGTPGVLEASMALVFLNLGFPPHITLFAILLYRIFNYWLPLPFGIFVYLRIRKSLKKEASVFV